MQGTFPVYDICKLSDFQQEDLLISRFATYLQKHRDLYFPHKHTFYHLVLFTKGAGTHAIDFKTFDVTPFQIYFMIPGQVHSWNFEGDVDGYVIHFSTSFFESFLLKNEYLDQFPFFSGIIDDAVIQIEPALQQKIIGLFEDIIAESITTDRMSLDLIRALLLQVFILLTRTNTGKEEKVQSFLFCWFCQLTVQTFHSRINLCLRKKKPCNAATLSAEFLKRVYLVLLPLRR